MSEKTKSTDKVQFTLCGYEAYTQVVKKVGSGAYVPIPRKHLGLEVKVIVLERPHEEDGK